METAKRDASPLIPENSLPRQKPPVRGKLREKSLDHHILYA